MKAKVKLNREFYLDSIREVIAVNGWKIADITNKLALESGGIDTGMYLEAARIICDALLSDDTRFAD